MLELMYGDSEGLKREQAWQGQLKKGTGQVGKSKKEQAMLELM